MANPESFVAAFLEHLEGEFGRHDDLEGLATTLLPRRAPFYETSVAVDLGDRPPGQSGLMFRYRIEFKANVDRILFAVSPSPAITESLLASVPQLTEVTTLTQDDDLDVETGVLLEGNLSVSIYESTERGTARFRDLELRRLDEGEVSETLSAVESSIPASQIRMLCTEDLKSSNRLSRVGISMTRRLDHDVWCLPWLADRPIFLKSFSISSMEVRSQTLRLETYPFMTSNEHAHALPTYGTDRVVLPLNHWLTAGQGVMMSWRPEDASGLATR